MALLPYLNFYTPQKQFRENLEDKHLHHTNLIILINAIVFQIYGVHFWIIVFFFLTLG